MLNAIPTDNQPLEKGGNWKAVWQAFFSSVHDWLGPIGGSGPTTARPVNQSRNPLYVGQMFFDTTLGYPVFVKSLNPTVWVNGAGSVV